jgi:hypothetical protein
MSKRRTTAAAPLAAPAASARDVPREIALAYRWAISGYAPKRYAGPVTLILSDDIDNTRDPALGWSRVAPQIRVCAVPGDHLSCITKYSHVLAERIKQCLGSKTAVATAMLLESVA